MQIKAKQRLIAASPELQKEAEKVYNWFVSRLGKPKNGDLQQRGVKEYNANEGLIRWYLESMKISLLLDRMGLEIYVESSLANFVVSSYNAKSLLQKLQTQLKLGLKNLDKKVKDFDLLLK